MRALIALLVVAACGKSSPPAIEPTPPLTTQPGAAPERAPIAWEPSPFRARVDSVIVADDHLLLREQKRVVAVRFEASEGVLAWQRELPEGAVVVALAGGAVALVGVYPEEPTRGEVVEVADGRVRAGFTLPGTSGMGFALREPGAAAFDVGRGYTFLRGVVVTTVELADGRVGPTHGIVDARGNLWVSGRGWAVLDPAARVLVDFQPEGATAWSFPPAFDARGDAWMFRWRQGREAELVAFDVARCLAPDRPAPDGDGFDDDCVRGRIAVPEIQRAPTIAIRDGVMVVSHGSVLHDDHRRFVNRRLDAFVDGALAWSRTLSQAGEPQPFALCGAEVAVLDRGNARRFALRTGEPTSSIDGAFEHLVCVGDRLALIARDRVRLAAD